MPVHNAETSLPRTMESIAMQSLADWELVAVNDRSGDGTQRLLRLAAEGDRRIRIFDTDPPGLVGALNTGLAAARGGLVARMDADDVMHPRRLELQVSALEARADWGLVGCLADFGGSGETGRGYQLHVEWTNSLQSPEEIRLGRFVESPFPHPSVCFRRELVERHGGYRDGDFPEDYELWLRWFEAGVVMGKVPERLLLWNDPPGRLSRTDTRYSMEAFFRLKAPYIAAELRRLGRAGKPCAVWGAGRLTRRRAEHLKAAGLRIEAYVDIDPAKTGRKAADGNPVLAPGTLPAPGELFILGYVGKRGAHEVLRGHLLPRGYVEGRDFLVCA